MTRMKLYGVKALDDTFLTATGIVLGFTHFWPVGIFILIGLFLKRKWFVRYNYLVLAITSIPLISGIWSSDPMGGLLFFIVGNVLYAAVHIPVDKVKVFRWIWMLLFIFSIAAFFEILILHDHRPETLIVKDASILGLLGLGFIHPLSGIAGSRTAVAAIWLFVIATGKVRYLLIAIISTLFLFIPIALQVTDVSRLSLTNISESQSLRNDLITTAPDFTWFGNGYNSYVIDYNLQRPHNVFILSVHDLGVLAIPFWILVAIGATRVPFRVLITLVPVGFFTDELFSRPEGLFLIYGMVLSAYVISPKFSFSVPFLIQSKDSGSVSRSS